MAFTALMKNLKFNIHIIASYLYKNRPLYGTWYYKSRTFILYGFVKMSTLHPVNHTDISLMPKV